MSVQDNNIHLYFYFCWLWVLFPCQDTFLILNFPESTHCQKNWRCQDELAEGVQMVGVDIMYQNSRLSSQTIYVTYLDYILTPLLCGNFSLTSKMGRCWNLLESSPARIPLIYLSHKWTRILFNISNSKLGIWLFSQPR